MGKLRWYAARLKQMGPAEVAHRAGQALIQRQRAARAGREPALRFYSDLPGLPPLTSPRQVRFFDITLPYTAEESIDWHRDYSTGIRAPLKFYGSLDYRNTAKVGDVKYTWELNRHQFLLPWALSYSRTGNEEDVAAIVHVLTDWIAANPRYIGINWASSLELALRLLSWGIVFDLCGQSELLRAIRPSVLRSVADQADYIRHSLSLYSSANNHLMGELVGLLAAGVYFPEATNTRKHAEFARELLLEETTTQNLPDGVNREQAIYYHHYTLEYLTTAIALFSKMGFSFPEANAKLVRRMVEFVDAMVDERGEPFEIGDRDDGTVTGLNLGTSVGIYESLLWTGWRLFGEAHFATHAAQIAASRQGIPQVDERTAYWHGNADAPQFHGTTRPTRRIFRDGGYFIASLPPDTRNLAGQECPAYSLLFKASPFGYPSIAAHSHADQLSVLLRIDGHDILTDSGTYCYHGEESWRRYFKGTAAHNSVRVDRKDQAEYAGPFLWATHADGELQGGERADDGTYTIAGVHRGYHRLPSLVDHSRTLEIRDHDPQNWLTILDTMASSAAHEYELIWNFGPDVTVELFDSKGEAEHSLSELLEATLNINIAQVSICSMTIISEHPFKLAIHHGDEREPAGWYSRQFGRRQAIYQVRAKVNAGWWGVRTVIKLNPVGTKFDYNSY